MNKILVKNDCVNVLDSDDLIKVTLSDKFDIYDIVKLKIVVIGSTEIEIEYKNKEETKMDITIEVLENVNVKIEEIKTGNNLKVQYHYYINEAASVIVNKFYNNERVKELDIVNLNGKYARIDYNFKTICTKEQKYDMVVYHNYDDTISNIINKGVNVDDGTLSFNVTSIVYNGKVNCSVDQNSRIINFNKNKCTIKPILLIDEANVIANHSALIGKFSESELFYLQSRGINKKDAVNLLVRGFLMDENNNKKISKLIDEYWR